MLILYPHIRFCSPDSVVEMSYLVNDLIKIHVCACRTGQRVEVAVVVRLANEMPVTR
jgi:hypothetical protein